MVMGTPFCQFVRLFATKIQLINWFLVVLLLVMLLGCSEPESAEAMVATKIEQIQQGIESKSADDVLDNIYDQFGTAKGQDKQWIKRTLAFYMLRHQAINTVITSIQVEVESIDSAKAQFNALLTGGEGLIPQRGALYRVQTDWRIEGGEWVLVYADWEKI